MSPGDRSQPALRRWSGCRRGRAAPHLLERSGEKVGPRPPDPGKRVAIGAHAEREERRHEAAGERLHLVPDQPGKGTSPPPPRALRAARAPCHAPTPSPRTRGPESPCPESECQSTNPASPGGFCLPFRSSASFGWRRPTREGCHASTYRAVSSCSSPAPPEPGPLADRVRRRDDLGGPGAGCRHSTERPAPEL